ncbi:MFS transporter [Planotetraspora mira]|uniref:MFS transporter n=1 Tax=Planotetraspora mira TaxID=58121 RepID=A0A8J3TXM6_9ACTN|nr:MFS transporter [Planotetraspora mira]GII34419.1 MFS transporter [Planotetraspora mira]
MDSRRWPALAVMLIAAYMDLLDTTIVTVALPSIQRDLGASDAALQWVAAGYTLAFALALITGGRLGDVYGRKTMFLTGIAGFTAASALSGLAAGPGMLVAARAVQGTAAAIMIPQLLTAIQVGFRQAERPRAFGLYGMVLALGGVSGPLLGGLLTEADLFGWGWRSIFLINVPVGVLALAGSAVLMTESRAHRRPRLDPLGTVLVTLGLLALVYPLIQGRELGWPIWTFLAMAASVPLLALFWVHEGRRGRAGASPLVDPRLFRSRPVIAGLLVALVFFASTGYFFVLTLHLQAGLGFGALRTGLAFLPFALGVIAGSGAAARLVPRLGRTVVTAGAVVEAAGILGMILVVGGAGDALEAWHLAPSLVLAGLGLALVSATLVTITLSGVPTDHAGSASGLVNTTLQLGSAVGVAALGALFFGLLTPEHGYQPAHYADASAHSLLLAAGLAALSCPLSLLLPRHALAGAGPGASSPARSSVP